MRKPLGLTRLSATPAPDVWHAHAALTLHAVPPRSTVTVVLDAGGLMPGGLAGLALFNRPYAWLAAECTTDGLALVQFDERGALTSRVLLPRSRVWLQAVCDFRTQQSVFRYSTDGKHFPSIGVPYLECVGAAHVPGIPCSLFACAIGASGDCGFAQFDTFLLATELDWSR
jgi:xylan 1,4-beta-xylosidase